MFDHAASRTAEATAFLRGVEQYRSLGVLEDPEALAFVPRALRWSAPLLGRLWARTQGVTGLTAYIVGRHRWMDDWLRSEQVEHVMLLGAGYDTRSSRLGGATFWEVDHPATSRRKRRKHPNHRGVSVPCDFERERLPSALQRVSFPVGARTVVIWEGVTMYLSEAALKQTLHDLGECVGPGSIVLLDALSRPQGRSLRDRFHRLSAASMRLSGERITLQPSLPTLAGWLEEAGLDVVEQLDARQLEASVVPGRVVMPAATVTCARWPAQRSSVPSGT